VAFTPARRCAGILVGGAGRTPEGVRRAPRAKRMANPVASAPRHGPARIARPVGRAGGVGYAVLRPLRRRPRDAADGDSWRRDLSKAAACWQADLAHRTYKFSSN